MESYESYQRQILRPVDTVYRLISDFSIFTPAIQGKVDDWKATADECSFKFKGLSMGLRIIDREVNKTVKITGTEGAPMDFTFWIQVKEVGPADTRLRLVLHAELNMAMKMMIGKRIQPALDKMADSIADSLNKA